MMSDMTICPYEVMIIVYHAWAKSFARRQTNAKAICERGWYPYNRNLLTHPSIRNTMTQQELADEEYQLNPTTILPSHAKHSSIIIDDDAPSYDNKFAIKSQPEFERKDLNFSQGMSAWCADNILRECDKHEARKRIKEDREKGKSLKVK